MFVIKCNLTTINMSSRNLKTCKISKRMLNIVSSIDSLKNLEEKNLIKCANRSPEWQLEKIAKFKEIVKKDLSQ